MALPFLEGDVTICVNLITVLINTGILLVVICTSKEGDNTKRPRIPSKPPKRPEPHVVSLKKF